MALFVYIGDILRMHDWNLFFFIFLKHYIVRKLEAQLFHFSKSIFSFKFMHSVAAFY